MDFQLELTRLLNQVSAENDSGTPDFILAAYLLKCLVAFDAAVLAREAWYGREPMKAAPNVPRQDVVTDSTSVPDSNNISSKDPQFVVASDDAPSLIEEGDK